MKSAPTPNRDARPWTVIVREGRVFSRYRADQSPPAIPATLCGAAIDVWECPASHADPPRIGEPVDPMRLGWTSITTTLCAEQPGRDHGLHR